MKVQTFGSQFLIKVLLLSVILLLASASLGTASVSASHQHHGHTNLTLCAALCETPVRRQESNNQTVSESRDQDETNDDFTFGTSSSNGGSEGALKPIFRSRVDRSSLHKQISVYLN